MRNLNEKSQLIGRLGADAKVSEVNDKTDVVNFDIAIDKSYTNKNGEKVAKTKWVRCTLYKAKGKTKVAEYLKKGQEVIVEGEFNAKAYTNKEGNAVAELVLTVSEFNFLSSPKASEMSVDAPIDREDTKGTSDDDDLPY